MSASAATGEEMGRGKTYRSRLAMAGGGALVLGGVIVAGLWVNTPGEKADKADPRRPSRTYGAGEEFRPIRSQAPAAIPLPQVAPPPPALSEPQPPPDAVAPVPTVTGSPVRLMAMWSASVPRAAAASSAASASRVAASGSEGNGGAGAPGSGGGSEYAQRMQSSRYGLVEPEPVRINADFTLMPGPFQCTPPSPISSEMVGPVQCTVQGDVRGKNGRIVLIPDKSTVHGTVERGLSRRNGDRRLWVVWQYVVTPEPDNLMIPLDAPGADPMGQMGVPGDYDSHLWQQIKRATILTAIDFVGNIATAAVQGGSRNTFNLGGVTQQGQSLAEMAFAEDSQIPPTLSRGPARTLTVYVKQPISLRKFYDLEVRR